jgi:spore coat protein U-like protein
MRVRIELFGFVALLFAACADDPITIAASSDAGFTINVDGGVGTASHQRVLGVTGGGADLESPNYNLQINVGVPSPIGQGSGGGKKIKLGTGAAR